MTPPSAVESAARTLESVTRRLSAYGREAARDAGLTVPQALTLRALRDTPEPTPAVVARRAGLSRSSMTSILDRLEAAGLVRRERSRDDRRRVHLVLTSVGASRAAGLSDPVLDLLEERLGTLSAEDLARVLEGLEVLSGALVGEAELTRGGQGTRRLDSMR